MVRQRADRPITWGAELDEPDRPPSRSARRLVGPVAAGLGIAVGAARFLAVDIAGIVTPDGLGYLRRSADPFATGFVTQGYRQVAYPLTMWISTKIGEIIGWDPIFGMALLQRTVLGVAIALTIWALRWWSVPLVALFTSATYVIHADYLLPEGLLVPLCIVCGALVATVVINRAATPHRARIVLAATVATTVLCASIKLQYATLLFVCVASAWLLVRDGLVTLRYVVACFASACTLLAVLALLQSIENRHEYGVFEPISERSLAEWYGAWMAVFGAHPERREDPALAEWYDEGNLYRAFDETTRSFPVYRERAAVLDERIDDLFDAAGTSRPREHAASFVGALSAGRTDDIGWRTDVILAAKPGDPWVRLAGNRLALSNQVDRLIAELNSGLDPGIVSFGPLFDATQDIAGDHRPVRGEIAWSSIVVMVLSLAIAGRHRPAVIGILTTMIAGAALLSTAFIDNARYLLGPLSIVAIGGVLAARPLIWLAWRATRSSRARVVLSSATTRWSRRWN